MLPNAALDEDSSITAVVRYRSIALSLRKELLAGRWRPGDRLPTEEELAQRFGVSPGTARLAVLELVKIGLLHRQQGRGTFVSALRFDQSLERFFRYGRRNSAEHIVPQTRLLGAGIIAADRETRSALDLEVEQNVGWLRRLRLYDGEPFLYHDSYFPLDLWRQMELHCDFELPSLYRQLHERCGTPVITAVEDLTPSNATKEHAELLGLAQGSAVVHLERHAYTFARKKIEFRRSTGRGDRFCYRVQL